MKSPSILLLVTGAMALSGCVSSHPLHRNAPVKIVTDPEGVKATSSYGDSCTTPCSLRLLMSKGGVITLEKEGYHTVRRIVSSQISSSKVAARSVNGTLQAIDPDPVDGAIDTIATLIDPKGQVSKLDTYRLDVAMTPLSEPEPFIEFIRAEAPVADSDAVASGSSDAQ